MDYEEMIKEAFKFRRLSLRRSVGRLFKRPDKPLNLSSKQSIEGKMFDQMMKEFVQANPRLAEKASGGASQQLTRKWQKHQQRFLQEHELPMSMMRPRLPSNPQVLAKQVKRHQRRATRPARKAQAGEAPQERLGTKGKAAVYGGSGIAIGAAGGKALSRQDDQPAAGYAGGGAYGY